MRASRTSSRVRSTLHLISAATLGLTSFALSPMPAFGIGLSAAVAPGEEQASSGGAAATALSQSSPSSPIGAEPVEPRVTDLPLQTLPATRRTTVDATVERVRWADGELVAHAVRTSVPEFAMVGVTWDQAEGLAEVTAQVRSLDDDGWSDWAALHAPDDEGPSGTEEPGARAGTQPGWVGSATGFEIAVYADKGVAPRNLEVSIIDPGTSPYDAQALAAPNASEQRSGTLRSNSRAGTFPKLPRVISREEWGADESVGDQCWDPRLGTTFKMVFVHHTAGSNDYAESESAAVVRGILAYHVVSRGWCDIGYNFLVDRYGNVYEGRSGGIRQPVRGAHSGDYNVNTTGISAMGNFDIAAPSEAMKSALVKLISWRLGTAYHGGFGRTSVEGDKFARISGHRDAMSTACPGRYIYDWLPTLRDRVRDRLGTNVTPIEARWRLLGGGKSPLGVVRIGEQGLNGGHFTAFSKGRMYASPAGVFSLYRGPILSRYKRAGEVEGVLGYPKSGMFAAGHDTGNGAMFAGGRIYWSVATRSRLLVRSPVLQRYLTEKGPRGSLGFPKTGIVDTSTGHQATFEHGTISYDKATRRTTITVP